MRNPAARNRRRRYRTPIALDVGAANPAIRRHLRRAFSGGNNFVPRGRRIAQDVSTGESDVAPQRGHRLARSFHRAIHFVHRTASESGGRAARNLERSPRDLEPSVHRLHPFRMHCRDNPSAPQGWLIRALPCSRALHSGLSADHSFLLFSGPLSGFNPRRTDS
jgi:hypothetical protein